MGLAAGKVVKILVLLLLVLALIPSRGAICQASDLRGRSIWDTPPAAQIQVKTATSDKKEKAEEDLIKEAKDKLSEVQAHRSAMPTEILSEFQKASDMSVLEYLKLYSHSEKDSEYQIGGQDVLSVRIYDEPELSRDDLRVSTEGQITLPLVGRIDINNLTTRAVEKTIEKKFRDGGFLRDPQVTVQIKEYKSRKVMVMGAVKSPGTYSLEGNERLMEVLAKAGGIQFDPHGDVAANSIRILRSIKMANKEVIRIAMGMDLESLTRGTKPEFNLRMADQDVVYVPEAPRFFVTGEVRAPGHYKLKDRPISVVEAITMAGGLTDKASGNRTRVVRTEGGKEETINVKVSDILDGDKNKDIQIRPNDVIVVPQSLF
jgi:polysaccharide export outer membrane protein